MAIDWDRLADRYAQLIQAGPRSQPELSAIDDLLGEAASGFPKNRVPDLAWFVAALNEPRKKWFVAKTLERVNPVPSILLDPLLAAALEESNPSANRVFIAPCVRTFGKEAVKVRLNELAAQSERYADESLAQAMYWAEAKN
ncbi:hypothetical protein [Dyella acidiphila]|uniref:HEAT repeat domain-containing protein n=1 Tax=Dyella acidiphila TaxID=2775866 RepID=A0ABR9GG34_9GAMM|nr:hypothetical protein [Dyella acidiphila]MBE1162988.1 hypothetical protein [Dyella acidiphila]